MEEAVKQKLIQKLEEATQWVSLFDDPMFQKWRNQVVEDGMKRVERDLIDGDLLTTEGKDVALSRVLAYRELKNLLDSQGVIWRHIKKETQAKLYGG